MTSIRMPKVLVGSSPFLAAGQFGHRSLEYLRRFVERPEAVAEVVEEALRVGVRGVQPVAYEYILEGFKLAMERTGVEACVVGSTTPDDVLGSIEDLARYGADAILLHGEVADSLPPLRLEELFRRIERLGAIPGIATHRPVSTLRRLISHRVKLPVAMVPVNALGAFMRDKEALLQILSKREFLAIAKKPLAAGRLEPEKALRYLFEEVKIDCVAIGVASVEEARETFSKALEIAQRAPSSL